MSRELVNEIACGLALFALLAVVVACACIDDTNNATREASIHDIITFIQGHE
jgi:hypothetical protein